MEIKIDKSGKHKLALRKLDEQTPLRRAARICELLAGFLEVFGDAEDIMLAAKRASVDLQLLIDEYCDSETVEKQTPKPTGPEAVQNVVEQKVVEQKKDNGSKKVKV